MLSLTLSQLDLISLPHCTSQREVSLFVELGVHLERSSATFVRYLLYRVDDRFHIVLFAPDSSSEGSSFTVEGDDGLIVLPRSFDGCDVEAELITCFERTRDMEARVTVVTINASAFVVPNLVLMVLVLAQLADCFVFCRRDHLETFSDLQSLGVTEANLWREDGAVDVHPIVAGGRLQRLSRENRTMKSQLVVRVVRTHGVGEFLLHALLLAISVVLLFVG
jgi:hypothetical protein